VASDILETNRECKNRKNAEKMAIRVEGSSSGECDSRWNRIAASPAKCKGNKARWNFYQGQVNFPVEDGQLLTQDEILYSERCSGDDQAPDEQKDRGDEDHKCEAKHRNKDESDKGAE
jgi:hypothetical protein